MKTAAISIATILLILATGCVPTKTGTHAGQGTGGPAQTASMGMPARDGKFEFTVTSLKRAQTAGGPTNPYSQAKAQGEFIIVGLTVRNIGDQAQTYFANNQKLVAAGKQYSASSEAAIYMPNSNMAEINPGLQVQPSVAFDVPVGTVPDDVDLHDSAFSGGVMVGLQGASIPAS